MESNNRKVLTLCIIHQGEKVLLGMKKKGLGLGRWNGFGGKVERGEEIIEAAKRETFEEAGIACQDIQPIGVLDFKWDSKPEILEVHIFKASNFTGKPTESGEMRPRWFNASEIPFGQMWPDDKFWLPLFLENKKFKGRFLFDQNDNIIRQNIQEI